MNVTINVDEMLKSINQDNKPSVSVGTLKQIVSQVERKFRKAGYGINDTEEKKLILIVLMRRLFWSMFLNSKKLIHQD